MRPLAIVVVLCALAQDGWAQPPAPLAGAALTHVGVAVRDVHISAQMYAAVFGGPVPKTTTTVMDAPGHRAARFKTATVLLPNFYIELNEPVGTDNPYTAFLSKYGEAIQYLGVMVPDRLPDRVKRLQEKGGTLTMGRPGGPVAFLDFTDLLGTTLKITERRNGSAAASPVPPKGGPVRLGSLSVNHVGLILRDVEKTARAFAELLGVEPPMMIVAKDIDYPADFAGNRKTEVKLSMARFGALALELQQDPGGNNPWNDSAKRLGGNGVEHVCFSIAATDLDNMRAFLAKRGGREVLGGPGSRYPHYDLFSQLGMMVELLASAQEPGR